MFFAKNWSCLVFRKTTVLWRKKQRGHSKGLRVRKWICNRSSCTWWSPELMWAALQPVSKQKCRSDLEVCYFIGRVWGQTARERDFKFSIDLENIYITHVNASNNSRPQERAVIYHYGFIVVKALLKVSMVIDTPAWQPENQHKTFRVWSTRGQINPNIGFCGGGVFFITYENC